MNKSDVWADSNIMDLINEAIHALYLLGVQPENIVIAMSYIIKSLLIEELSKLYPIDTPKKGNLKLFGIGINDEWPYNEIVVYDKYNACNNDQFIIKLKFRKTR